MRIFVQSASVDQIRHISESGLADGVSLELKDLPNTEAVHERLADIAREFAIPVCVPVTAFSENEIYREARELARVADHVIVQVPFVEDAIGAIRRLVADGVQVCASYVYSGVQAYFAAKVGATMVAVQVADLDAHGQRSAQVVGEIRDVLDQADLECDLMISTPRSSNHFTESLLAGADSICLTPEIMSELMLNSLTDRGVDRFLSDVSRRHKPRGA
jgi:transaldolase